jgi:hypothetical protein
MNPSSSSSSLQEVQNKIAELSKAILSDHPRLPFLLEDIRKNLQQDPLNVTLLSEEEISKVVLGLSTATGIAFAAPKKSPGIKKLDVSALSLSDF